MTCNVSNKMLNPNLSVFVY